MFDSVFDARELIGQAVGAGSVCWENPAGAGVFDSTMAAEVADAVALACAGAYRLGDPIPFIPNERQVGALGRVEWP